MATLSARASLHAPAARTQGVRAPLCVHRPAVARFGGGRGDVLDKPVEIKTGGWDSGKDSNVGTLPPPTETGRNDGNTTRQKASPPGGGSWRVILLDSPKHTEKAVVRAITRVINVDEAHARNCFATSKQLGMAIVTSVLKEIAEHYVQQLWGNGLRVSMEPDGSTA